MPGDPDKQKAAELAAGVSNQLIGSCLALLGILGAALIFALDKRAFTTASVVLISCSFVCLVLSVGAGARGVAKLYTKGYGGDWDYRTGGLWFQSQAVFAMVAVVVFGIGVATMSARDSSVEGRRTHLTVDSLQADLVRDSDRIAHIERRIATLDSVVRATGLPVDRPGDEKSAPPNKTK